MSTETTHHRGPTTVGMVPNDSAVQTVDEDGVVVDIGLAGEQLRSLLSELNFRNLDDEPAFAGRNTTTEVLAREIFDRLLSAIRDGKLGATARGLTSMCVTLHESHVAWASYDGEV